MNRNENVSNVINTFCTSEEWMNCFIKVCGSWKLKKNLNLISKSFCFVNRTQLCTDFRAKNILLTTLLLQLNIDRRRPLIKSHVKTCGFTLWIPVFNFWNTSCVPFWTFFCSFVNSRYALIFTVNFLAAAEPHFFFEFSYKMSSYKLTSLHRKNYFRRNAQLLLIFNISNQHILYYRDK